MMQFLSWCFFLRVLDPKHAGMVLVLCLAETDIEPSPFTYEIRTPPHLRGGNA